MAYKSMLTPMTAPKPPSANPTPSKHQKEPRTTVSLRGNLLNKAQSRADALHGGNLSGYIQALIEKDMSDMPPSISKSSDKVIEELAKTYRPDIAESITRTLNQHEFDQRKALGEILGSLDAILPRNDPIVKFIEKHSPSIGKAAREAFATTDQIQFANELARQLIDYTCEVAGTESCHTPGEAERRAKKREKGFLAYGEDTPRIVPQGVLDLMNQELSEAHHVLIRANELKGFDKIAEVNVSKGPLKYITKWAPCFNVRPRPYRSLAERQHAGEDERPTRELEEEYEKQVADETDLGPRTKRQGPR